MPSKYFLTTAIDYVNGAPHLGHAYEKVLADFFARFRRSLGHQVYFLTGVDEHGQKVQQSAIQANEEPISFCDRMTARFKSMHERLGVSSSTFVRTTNPDHKRVVCQFLRHLFDKGEIFFQEHEGFYSERQEQFVTEKDMVDGKWPEIFGEVVRRKEPNYFFRLEPYRERLTQYYLANQEFIVPSFRANEVLSAIGQPLEPLCISRPKSRLSWGIPLPFDENYVTYVWFDALVNYFSFALADDPTNWPADLHIIGKDILVPAHGIYWPIMLLAMGYELPKKILVHGFWTVESRKISKSDAKTIVDFGPYIDIFGTDALRYFLLREMVLGQDADFSLNRFEVRYGELEKGLGNFVKRTLSMINSYCDGLVPAYTEADITPAEAELRSNAFVEEYKEQALAFAPNLALEAIRKLWTAGNVYIERMQPFKMKDPSQHQRRAVILAHLAETVRRLSVLIEPALPNTSLKIRKQLEWSLVHGKLETAYFGDTLAGHKITKEDCLKEDYLFTGLETSIKLTVAYQELLGDSEPATP